MNDRFRLDGVNALVTGGSGGLGRHFAEVLAAAGARVAVTARRTDKLDETVAAIEATGGSAVAAAMDVTERQSVTAALATVVDALGPIGVLVNNAGIAIPATVLDVDAEDWDAVVDTNLRGAWMVAQETAKSMVEAGQGGAIVNIASIVGLRPGVGLVSYAAAKAGLIQATKSMAIELARHKIRVNAMAPGYVGTDLNRDLFDSDAGRRMIERIPQRRIGTMDELDGPLLLLASEASSYMTGAVLVVDGGHVISGL